MSNQQNMGAIRAALIAVLDTNCGYTGEEPAEKVADRILNSGIVRRLITCGECKHCEKRSPDCLICQHPKNAYHAQACFCEPDDFCSYGDAGEWDGRYGDERSDG